MVAGYFPERKVSPEDWVEMLVWKANLERDPTKEEVVQWLKDRGYVNEQPIPEQTGQAESSQASRIQTSEEEGENEPGSTAD